MKDCDILGVKTYSDPCYIFSGGQDPTAPISTPLHRLLLLTALQPPATRHWT